MSSNKTTIYRVPGFFMPHIESFVAERGGNVDLLYAAAGLQLSTFLPHEDFFSEDQFYAIVKTAVRLSNDSAFGLGIGQRFNLGSFGLLSRALMSCATLRDVSIMLERYSVLVLPMVRFSSSQNESDTVLEVSTLSRYPELNQTIFEALISLSTKIFPLLLGRDLAVEKICCQFESPPYSNLFSVAMAKKFEFGTEKNLIVFNKKWTTLKLITANSTDAASTMDECENALIRSLQTKNLTEKVVDHVRYYLDTNPSSKEIAQKLNLTERTFRRRLAEEDTNYRALIRDIREELAMYYLSQTRLQIAQIAPKLGYGETSNFRSAFKSWTGHSPRHWRQLHQQK